MTARFDSETLATSAAGAVLGGFVGRVVGWPRLGSIVGAVHGWRAGRRRIYEWNHRRGVVAFVLDHTWALATTTAGTVVMTVSELRSRSGAPDAGFDHELSHRRNRFVYRRGLVLRRGFALTAGTVITGAADPAGEITERRRRLIDDHEDVHVWQARFFGPAYPLLYASWFVGGVALALVRRLRFRSSGSLAHDIDALAYYRNPFEWHAYTCDDNWPPANVDRGAVWRRAFPVREWLPKSLRESAGNRAEPR